jgi:hypothetical protein
MTNSYWYGARKKVWYPLYQGIEEKAIGSVIFLTLDYELKLTQNID